MNYPDSGTVTTPGKKIRFSSAALALIVGLALLLPGAAALATPGTPIQGIPVGLEGDPGSVKVSTKTDKNGAFNFTKLPAGKYKLTLPGLSPQSVIVGEKGNIGGVLSKQPGGKASITFNGQDGVVPDLPSAPVSTTRSNKKAGIAKGEGGAVKSGILDQGAAGNLSSYGTASPPTNEDGKLPGLAGEPIVIGGIVIVSRAAPPKGDDVKPGLAIQGEPIVKIPIGLEGDPGSIKVSATTGPDGAFHFDKLPAGKYKLTLPGLPSQSLTVGADGIAGGKVMKGSDGSMSIFDRWGNRTDTSPKGGDEKPGISDQGTVGGLISYSTAPPPKDGKLPSKVGDPIPGVGVGLEGDDDMRTAPGGGGDKEPPSKVGGIPIPIIALDRPGYPITSITISLPANPDAKALVSGDEKDLSLGTRVAQETTTGPDGAYQFTGLPAGKYKLTLPGMSPQSVTVGPDGTAGGKVMRGSDGSIKVFDRWGNSVASSPKDEGIKAAGTPFSFGSGNTPGVGPGMSAGPGMDPGMRPAAGPIMGGSMSPGPSPVMSGGPMGQGGAMGGRGAGKP